MELLDGVLVNKVAVTGLISTNSIPLRQGRYLGTIRATAATTTEDSYTKRFVWNMYNRVSRRLYKNDTTASWSGSGTAWRQANGAAANQVDVVCGQEESPIDITVHGMYGNTGASASGMNAIGEDLTNAVAADCSYTQAFLANANDVLPTTARLAKIVALGYHFYSWIERTDNATASAFYGDSANLRRPGIIGTYHA